MNTLAASLPAVTTSHQAIFTTPLRGNEGSHLGKIVCACQIKRKVASPTWVKPAFETIIRTEYTPGKPRYSTAHLQRAHLILSQGDGLMRDLAYCHAIQKTFSTASVLFGRARWQFGADQSILAHRVSAMTSATAKVLGLLPSDPCEPVTSINHQHLPQPKRRVVKSHRPLCTITGLTPVNAPSEYQRCPHDVLCKPGETYSDICQACRLGFGPWEHSRKTHAVSNDRPLNNVDDRDICDETQPIEDHTIKQKKRLSIPTKQAAEWEQVFSDAKLPAESRDFNIAVSLTSDGDVPTDRRNYHERNAYQVFEAKQQWKQVGVEVGPRCLRCDSPLGKRKGTLFCSDNCRKRYHEEGGRDKC